MLIPHPVLGKKKSADICRAFAIGAGPYAKGDVFYGVDAHSLPRLRASKNYWYIDNSYFDVVRGQQFRVTHNAIQVDPGKHESDGKRFDRLGLKVKPWRFIEGKYTLFCPQSPWFMAAVAQWKGDWLAQQLLTFGGEQLRIRPWNSDKLTIAESFRKDLAGARHLITHSSAAAVEALLEGVPVTVARMSAVFGIDPQHDTRLHAMRVLADNQFTLEEMRSGYAWEKLRGEATKAVVPP